MDLSQFKEDEEEEKQDVEFIFFIYILYIYILLLFFRGIQSRRLNVKNTEMLVRQCPAAIRTRPT